MGAVSSLTETLFGGSSASSTSRNLPEITPEEQELLSLNSKLARAQVNSYAQLQPFQQQLIQQALEDIVPKSGQPQFDQIRAATDQAIAAGTGDIDRSTRQGVGIISDQIANARGLRLSDAPILREAGLLSQNAEDQKASLIKNLRANQSQQELAYNQFQQELQQQAAQNRLALTGSLGLGLSNPSALGIGLSTLSNERIAGASTDTSTVKGGLFSNLPINPAGKLGDPLGLGKVIGIKPGQTFGQFTQARV